MRPQANLPYLPPELLSHIVHLASDPSTVLTMHLLSRRYFVECQLAIDTVLSRQPMAAYLCAYSSYHRLLLLGRATQHQQGPPPWRDHHHRSRRPRRCQTLAIRLRKR